MLEYGPPGGGGWPTDQTFQTRAAVLGVAGPHPQGEPMRGSTGSVSNPVFIIGIPVMVIIADLVTRGVPQLLMAPGGHGGRGSAAFVAASSRHGRLRPASGSQDAGRGDSARVGRASSSGTGQAARFQTNEPWCWKRAGACSCGEVMERPLNPATAPTFLIGVAVIVLLGRLVTAGIENFWWRLLAMTLIGLVLSWPLRFFMQASDRRFGRERQEDAMRPE